MRIAKNVGRWFLILFCLGALAQCGLFSVSGIMALLIAFFALPFAPVRALWSRFLPPESPRFAKGAILAATFLVVLAAAPGTAEKKETAALPEATPVSSPAATTTPEPTQSPTPTPAPTATPAPTSAPTIAPTPVPVAEVPTAVPEQSAAAETENGAAPVPEEAATEDASAYTAPQSGTVYIAGSGNGKRYHSNPNCSNMNDPVPLTQAEAEARGYSPCKRCY